MQIGDLVKFGNWMQGLQECLGIIVGFNGDAAEVRWLDRLAGLDPDSATSTELVEFLEVVNEDW